MSRAEKVLYHQIHPFKLAVDISSSVASSALLWQHQMALAMLAGFIPSILASAGMVWLLPLEAQKHSALGRYVSRVMTPAVTAQRMTGQVVMWIGAYRHEPAYLALGALVVVLAWLSGLGSEAPA